MSEDLTWHLKSSRQERFFQLRSSPSHWNEQEIQDFFNYFVVKKTVVNCDCILYPYSENEIYEEFRVSRITGRISLAEDGKVSMEKAKRYQLIQEALEILSPLDFKNYDLDRIGRSTSSQILHSKLIQLHTILNSKYRGSPHHILRQFIDSLQFLVYPKRSMGKDDFVGLFFELCRFVTLIFSDTATVKQNHITYTKKLNHRCSPASVTLTTKPDMAVLMTVQGLTFPPVGERSKTVALVQAMTGFKHITDNSHTKCNATEFEGSQSGDVVYQRDEHRDLEGVGATEHPGAPCSDNVVRGTTSYGRDHHQNGISMSSEEDTFINCLLHQIIADMMVAFDSYCDSPCYDNEDENKALRYGIGLVGTKVVFVTLCILHDEQEEDLELTLSPEGFSYSKLAGKNLHTDVFVTRQLDLLVKDDRKQITDTLVAMMDLTHCPVLLV